VNFKIHSLEVELLGTKEADRRRLLPVTGSQGQLKGGDLRGQVDLST
jgi:hypothetical protein